jgi:wobble nucleotide-excising tRNase
MIRSIRIHGAATYHEEVHLDELRTLNYFFGANGSGKTTISRIIDDETQFVSSALDWKGGQPLETLVYNRDFVARNFHQGDHLPGIFTLGEDCAKALKLLEDLRIKLEKNEAEIAGLAGTLDGDNGKKKDLETTHEELRQRCWKQKQKHDDVFQFAFKGLRSDSKKFTQKILSVRSTNTAELRSLAELTGRAETVFSEAPSRIEKLPVPNCSDLLGVEAHAILSKKVIGKSDVDIAGMIERLENSDWVRNGLQYLRANDGHCPFCQQSVTDDLSSQLSSYFDDQFVADTKAITDLSSAYGRSVGHLLESLSLEEHPAARFLDLPLLEAERRALKLQLDSNCRALDTKRKEPSRTVTLVSSRDLVARIASMIQSANVKVDAHNSTLDNLDKERVALTDQVWKYLIEEELGDALSEFDRKCGALEAAIQSLQSKLTAAESERASIRNEIKTLERNTTSIEPTVNEINSLLSSFGFDSFSLSSLPNQPRYRLVRRDGSSAMESLSEGERSFVTFLYFYQLLKGSPSASGTSGNRVVVIDDPVTSLDSEVLFVVSTLIRRLVGEVRSRSSHVKQVFVLTHNVYFHKEVTFAPRRGNNSLRDETFWLVRKLNGESQVDRCTSNPVRTSYELLWSEIRNPQPDPITLQNTMRRILESYFKIICGIELDNIQNSFDGRDQLACRSLLSWVHDGSHSAHEDLYVTVSDTTVETYQRVFRMIFDKAEHLPHFEMMMNRDLPVGSFSESTEEQDRSKETSTQAMSTDESHGGTTVP